MSTPLGIRQHNPGNIEHGPKWQGLAPPAHKRFASFTEPKWGIRALAVTILTYYRSRQAADGSRIDTLKEVIQRWAPGFENNVDAYVAHVDELHPAAADEVIALDQYENLMPLVVGIIQHENGPGPLPAGRWYKQEVIDEALALAGVKKPDTVTKAEVAVAATAAGTTAAGGVAVAVEAASRLDGVVDIPVSIPATPDTIEQVAQAVQTGLTPIAHLSVWLGFFMAAVVTGFLIYRIIKKRKQP